MEHAIQPVPVVEDDSTTMVRVAGDRLMSLSNLRYEGEFVSVGEYENVHVMEFGSGPPVLLVHGAGSGGPSWHRQVAALAVDHRVIVPDIPMFGLSGMPDRIHSPREQIADVILGIMDLMEIETTDIAGHSMGALASLGALMREPDRFQRAVLLSSPGFGRGLNFVLRLASVPALQRFVNYGSRRARNVYFDYFEAQKSGPSDEREMWKDLHFQVGNRDKGVEAFHQGLTSFAGISGQRDVIDAEMAAKISAKTLLIWGDSDLIIPTRHSKRANELISGSRLEIIDNCGHIVQLEAPDRVTSLMTEWLRVS